MWGEREKERDQCESETSISFLLYAPFQGPTPTWACVITGNQTGNLLLYGTVSSQLSHTTQGKDDFKGENKTVPLGKQFNI